MIEIEFGTLISVRNRPSRVDVITDVGSGEGFISWRIFNDKNNAPCLRMIAGGTMLKEYIEEVVGKMTFEEVEQAVLRGFTDRESARQTINYFRKSYLKGKRSF